MHRYHKDRLSARLSASAAPRTGARRAVGSRRITNSAVIFAREHCGSGKWKECPPVNSDQSAVVIRWHEGGRRRDAWPCRIPDPLCRRPVMRPQWRSVRTPNMTIVRQSHICRRKEGSRRHPQCLDNLFDCCFGRKKAFCQPLTAETHILVPGQAVNQNLRLSLKFRTR